MKFFINGERSRTLSIVSAPHEDTIRFAFRVKEKEEERSDFKKYIMSLQSGDTVELRDPTGENVYPYHKDANRPAVLIAGRIGITPFMSILKHAGHKGDKNRFVLLYANPTQKDIAFKEELDELEREGVVTIHYFLTKEKNENVTTGRFTEKDIKEFLKIQGKRPIFYVAGGEIMTEQTTQLLQSCGVSDASIRCTTFGYDE